MKKCNSAMVKLDFARAHFSLVGALRQGGALLLSAAIALSPSLTLAAEKSSDTVLAKTSASRASRGSGSASKFADHGNSGGDENEDSSCNLGSRFNPIKHVIYIQFDNVHFERDNPNVPSDLELMPHLLSFMKGNGSLLTNSHTPLISHTADDIITSITGVYGDRHGIPVANSFGYFPAPGTSTAADLFSSSFTYWTDPVSSATPPADPYKIMLAANGKNAPAPWVAYTRAGCNFGAVSLANMEFENITSDIFNVFPDPTSPQNMEAKNATTSALKAQAVADFEGIAIHCARSSSLCSTANGGGPDVLPDEPGGYIGFNALYGHKYAIPPINGGSASLSDLDGNVITDASTPANVGFPGFSGIDAAQTLAYIAQMQENGVPVTFGYISDVHDNPMRVNHNAPAACKTDTETGGLGPGDVCHNALAAAYDEAFDKFFTRLANDGIDTSNTLFVICTEEQDHFAGGPASPANCDGVNVPCTYEKLGEVDVNTTALLNALDPNLASTPFDIHFDMAPTFYIKGNPAPNASITREYERAASQLTAVSPITGNTDMLAVALADPVEMKLLHMVTADPQRTPNFVMFGNADYYFQTTGSPAVAESPAFAYNHGGIQPEITTVWAGFAGPGIKKRGVDASTFADETDYRPTMLALLGLKDQYQHEGRVLAEEFEPSALPKGIVADPDAFLSVATALKQINAPLGQLGQESLRISTVALKGNDPGDATYTKLENQLSSVTTARDALAARMLSVLEDAEFNGNRVTKLEAFPLVTEAYLLLAGVHLLDLVTSK
ncbi:MAG TPA: hypothetical protein VMH31_06910 [Methylomirabilota bacterium]|nr:hypothetical protein [Methylomirabilota bacterium]